MVEQTEHERVNFDELPQAVKEFLSDLRDDDVSTIKEGMELAKAARTIGRFTKWLVITVFGIFLGTVMFYESLLKVLGWLKGSPP